MKGLIVLSLFATIILAAQFNITSTSLCTNVSAQGFCLRWQQSGTVQENYGSCFPAHAQVMTSEGLIRMDKLQKGDKILGLHNGKEIYTQVTSWFHHDPQTVAEYLKINVGQNHFEVSAKHNIAMQDLSYKFAEQIQGSSLYGVGHIDSIDKIQSQGLYSPKTTTNNYFIYLNGNPQKKILAHCFAHIRNPQAYQMAVESIQMLWNMFDETESTQVHPSYEWMRTVFTFLQQQ